MSPPARSCGLPAAAATSITFPTVPPGVYYFHIRAKDQAGNWGATVQRMVTVN